MPIVPTQTLILAFMGTVIAEGLEVIVSHAQEQPIRVLLDPVFAEEMQSVQGTQTLALRAIVNAEQIMHAPALLIPASLESVGVALPLPPLLFHALDYPIFVPLESVNVEQMMHAPQE